jgi:hypothetical protein
MVERDHQGKLPLQPTRYQALVVCCAALLAPRLALASVITGTVVGEGSRPLAGAVVEVVRDNAEALCAITSAADGSFSLPCAASGRYTVRASFGHLRSWQIDDVELDPGREVHLNFVLLPVASENPTDARSDDAPNFWSRRLPNPVLTTWQGHWITLRITAIVVAGISFVLGAVTMVAIGRRFGVQRRRLSDGEVGEMILNPHMPVVGERITPVAVTGARGAAAGISYGADEIAAALAARHYGLVFAALVAAPGLFALFGTALAVAMLIEHELYLLYGMLLVPTGFVLTPIIIGIQALRRGRKLRRMFRETT